MLVLGQGTGQGVTKDLVNAELGWGGFWFRDTVEDAAKGFMLRVVGVVSMNM